MNNVNLNVTNALDALTGEVSEEYSASVQGNWESLQRKHVAYIAMKETAKASRRVLHRYIRRRLKLGALEHVAFTGVCFSVQHDKKPELRVPYITFEVYCATGIIMAVHTCAKTQTQLDVIIERVRDAVAAQRREQKQ